MLALSTFPALVNTVYILNLREEMYDRDFEVAKKIQKSKSLSPILIGIEMKEKLREMGLGNGFSCLLNYGTTFVRRLRRYLSTNNLTYLPPTPHNIDIQNIRYIHNISLNSFFLAKML